MTLNILIIIMKSRRNLFQKIINIYLYSYIFEENNEVQ